MVDWRTSLGPIYIKNFNLFKYVCEINTQTGVIIERERSELPEEIKTWRGFYKDIDIGVIGLFASSIGPILFINQDMYPLIEGDYDIEWVKKGKDLTRREFTFYYKGEEIYRIEYDEVECLYTNPYEIDEQVRDFFCWVYQIQTDENNYNHFKYSKVD